MVDRDVQALRRKSCRDAVLFQDGRKLPLKIKALPPDIQLISLSVEDIIWQRSISQDITLELRNKGSRTAVILDWRLIVEKCAIMTNCMHPQGKLIREEWAYDFDLDDSDPRFEERESIARHERKSVSASVGRKAGGPDYMVYRCRLRLSFSNDGVLETGRFFVRILGPEVLYSQTYESVTDEEWGRCMARNIRRLDRIGYDYRPLISERSKRYIIDVAPELFS